MDKIINFLEDWYWPIVIVIFPMYSCFERGVDIKFYGSIFLVFVTVLSIFVHTNHTMRVKDLAVASFLVLVFIFFNRVPSNPLWVFHFMCVTSGLILLNQFGWIMGQAPLREKVALAIGVVGIVSSIHMILNHYNIDPWFSSLSNTYRWVGGQNELAIRGTLPPWGFLGNQNHSSMISVMAVPFMFNKRLFWGIPLALAAVYFSDSAMSIGSLVGGVGIYFLLMRIPMWYKVVGSLLGTTAFGWVVFLYPSFFRASDRGAKWLAAMNMVEAPFGYGLSYFRMYFTTFAKKQGVVFNPGEYWAQAHNEYIELYVIFGFIALPLLIFLLSRLRPNYKNAAWVASFAAIMLNSIGNFPWHLPFLALLGIITYSVSCINKESL